MTQNLTKALIENLLNKDIKVSCLVTLSDNAKNLYSVAGQSNKLAESFSDRNIKVLKVDDYTLSNHDYASYFESSKFDLGLCTGWQRIIPNNILKHLNMGYLDGMVQASIFQMVKVGRHLTGQYV